MAHRKKDIEANPIVYDGLIYVPTPGNLSSYVFEAFSDFTNIIIIFSALYVVCRNSNSISFVIPVRLKSNNNN